MIKLIAVFAAGELIGFIVAALMMAAGGEE